MESFRSIKYGNPIVRTILKLFSFMTMRRHFSSLAHSGMKPCICEPIRLEKLFSRRIRNTPTNTQIHESYNDNSAYNDIISRYTYTGSCDPYLAKTFHVEQIKKGFHNDMFLSNNLMKFYQKGRNMKAAQKVFDLMPERNVVSWTCLITGYTHFGFPDLACQIFHEMISWGVQPTQFTFGSVLHACQDSNQLSFGTQIHGLISKSEYSFDNVVCNALIMMYGNSSQEPTYNAQKVFDYMPFKNLIIWNGIISIHSKKGDVFSTFNFLSQMQNGGFRPNEYTFSSLIGATNYHKSSTKLVDQVFSMVYKYGLFDDLYVGSSLVSAFAKLGIIERANNIFLNMKMKNVVTMNGLMVGLVKQGLGEEALEIFKEMKGKLGFNSDTYVVLLSALVEFEFLEKGLRIGKVVHGTILRTGLFNKVAIGNSLINLYAKNGQIKEAFKVFDQMCLKDQISWNSLIVGFDQNGHFDKAFRLYKKMKEIRVLISDFAIMGALSSCANLKSLRAGTQIHCDGIKFGINSNISVSNSLISFYGQCENLFESHKVFDEMHEYDIVSWNSMIGAFANSNYQIEKTILFFQKMLRKGWEPNKVTFVNLLSALSPLSFLELSKQIHAKIIKQGLSKEFIIENALISCYSKLGDLQSCEDLFAKMDGRKDSISYNSMLGGYIHNGYFRKAINFILLMVTKKLKMDYISLSTILNACASKAALKHGMEIHAFSLRAFLEFDIVVQSSLIDMYSKCGKIDYAYRIFNLTGSKNNFIFNCMILGFARNGLSKKALEIFNEMITFNNLLPDYVTFVGVLSACSYAGFVEKGLEYFEMIKSYDLVPGLEHYSCVIDLLGRIGDVEKLEDFIRKMPIRPNNYILRTVLSTCAISKNGMRSEIVREACETLLRLEPWNPENYVLIANYNAAKGNWANVAKIHEEMREFAVKKKAGHSWIALNEN